MKILVVEDTEDSRVLLVDQLEARGYEVAFACDGVEAIERLGHFPADLIVSDILMPNMDGYELCKRLKTNEKYQGIPLVFYTATYTEPKDREIALSLGASGFLIKPASEKDLSNLIESLISGIKRKTVPVPTSLKVDVAEYDHTKTEVLSRKLDKRNRQLQVQKEEFRIIADALPVLIAEVDSNHNYTFANKTHEEWCRVPLQNIVGQQMSKVLGGEIYKTVKKFLNYAGENNNREYLFSFPDGRDRYVTFNIKPQIDKSGDVSKFIILMSDVTRIKKSEIEISLYKDHLEELVQARTAQLSMINRELEAFSYTVSHDLRNPIKSIEAFSLALEEEMDQKLNENAVDYLTRIKKLTIRMDNLIQDLMSLFQITKKDLKLEEVSLSDMARDIITELKQTTDTGKLETFVGNDLRVIADEGLIRVVLENLIANAWKFSNKKATPVIVIDGYEKDGFLVIFVKDNGTGFDEKYMEKIFTPFQRLHNSEEYPGTGIGLATVKRVIHRHGGSVWATGNEGEGSCFYFSLPTDAQLTANSRIISETDVFGVL